MAIFGKKSSSPAEKDSPRPEARPTYVGPKVTLRGELGGDEDIVFDGRLEGRVAASRTFRVGPSGHVRAEIEARAVVIGGRVEGNVAGSERVEIQPTGSLEGNIRAPKIVVADGARFRGSVDMESRGEGGAPPPGSDGPVRDAPRKDQT
ncbi:MAG: polymer-forming cytoskeletal protein [Thermoanaerobaculia bacterium]